jgi:hypothetical protein
LKPFDKIYIYVIPHNQQRYDTCGDWFIDDFGNWCINVSDLGDPRYNFLVALHELVEMALCIERGITADVVDRFDIGYDGKYLDDPGVDPKAPYHREHMSATVVERDLARKLHVGWEKYNKAIDELPEIKR